MDRLSEPSLKKRDGIVGKMRIRARLFFIELRRQRSRHDVSLTVANICADRFELTLPVEPSFGHDHCAGTASQKMPVPERMQRMLAPVVGTDPARHRRER